MTSTGKLQDSGDARAAGCAADDDRLHGLEHAVAQLRGQERGQARGVLDEKSVAGLREMRINPQRDVDRFRPVDRGRLQATGRDGVRARRSAMPEGRPGIPDITPHDLRHTAASLAISAGANVKAVQTMLGHKSAAMTLDTYSGDLFLDDLDAVAARPDEAVRTEGVSGRRPDDAARSFTYPLTWANRVELRGIEPLTSSMRTKRATNCATAPRPADPSASRPSG